MFLPRAEMRIGKECQLARTRPRRNIQPRTHDRPHQLWVAQPRGVNAGVPDRFSSTTPVGPGPSSELKPEEPAFPVLRSAIVGYEADAGVAVSNGTCLPGHLLYDGGAKPDRVRGDTARRSRTRSLPRSLIAVASCHGSPKRAQRTSRQESKLRPSATSQFRLILRHTRGASTSGREPACWPPKEQPPRKLSGTRTVRRSTLWKAEHLLPPTV